MTTDNIEKLEERLSILEFKLDLVLKLTKNDLNLTLNDSKTMIEFAYVMNLNKTEYDELNDLLSTQINFYKSLKQNTYMSPRQYTKLDDDVNIFVALSKEEFEESVWRIIPKLNGNKEICEKIAKINGITEMYYDELAKTIHKTKHERLDKETKMKHSYQENKETVDNLFNGLSMLKQELDSNLSQVESIIDFFTKNELVKISIFYNGELWEKGEDDKRVVINEDTYIHNVCFTEKDEILTTFTEVLKAKETEYKELLIHILKSGPTSSKKIESLQEFYKTLRVYNKNEHIIKEEMINLKEEIEKNIKISEAMITTYNEYVSSL